MKTAILTGCNKKFVQQTLFLFKSLIDNKVLDDCDFCLFNIDLSETDLKKFKHPKLKVIEPKWDYKFKFNTPDWKKLLTIRPFLKNYFPNYENYIWLDADTFVQSNKFLETFNQISLKDKMSIVAELDINYEINRKKYNLRKVFKNLYLVKGFVYRHYNKYFDEETARKLFLKPLLNAGVFSIPASSNIWDLWALEFEKVIYRSNDDHCLSMDQSCLNKVVYENIESTIILESKYNYICKNAYPVLNEHENYFCLPSYPFDKIEIMHLTQINQFKDQKILNTEGNEIIAKFLPLKNKNIIYT